MKWRAIAQRSGLEDKPLDEALGKISKSDRQKGEQLASEWSDRIQVQPLE